MTLIPMQINKLRLTHAKTSDSEWLLSILNREGEKLGTHFTMSEGQKFSMLWD